ncbi:SpoIIE family protein phosphatase, partial [candidate division KSB3 bacterium]|nr:SpoIIE family protein phosphatase [candidate division KSB3 bacterium]MBD3324212.1 SpoIIE family protein phosphatase [candidate division KSB3 bacterium]
QIRIEATTDVREILASLNHLVRGQATNQYMTLFLGVIYVQAQTITYCNAGHNFPYVLSVRDHSLHYLENSSLPLGFVHHDPLPPSVYHFHEEDILFFYTDGVVEAMNEEGELYGYPRLEQLLLSHSNDDLLTIHLKILEHLESFCRETPQDDDMTLILMHKPRQKSLIAC